MVATPMDGLGSIQGVPSIQIDPCKTSSDDGLLACGWIKEPEAGSEFPAWRVLAIEPADNT